MLTKTLAEIGTKHLANANLGVGFEVLTAVTIKSTYPGM
jgi:hypothetical protein